RDVGEAIQATRSQVHEQKREVIEDVCRGERGVEFQGVEGGDPSVEDADVAQVEVAVAAARPAGASSGLDHGSKPGDLVFERAEQQVGRRLDAKAGSPIGLKPAQTIDDAAVA